MQSVLSQAYGKSRLHKVYLTLTKSNVMPLDKF